MLTLTLKRKKNLQLVESNFITRLKKAMLDASVTQSSLARTLSTPMSTIQRWMQGAVPRRLMLQALAEALHVTPEWLIHGREPSAGLQESMEPESVVRYPKMDHRWHERREELEAELLTMIRAFTANAATKDQSEIATLRSQAHAFIDDYFDDAARLGEAREPPKVNFRDLQK